MIVFTFDYETHNSDGTLKPRPIYWLGCTEVTPADKGDEDEIFEQLEAQTCGLADYDELDDWKWPYDRINSSGTKEYGCPHGVGHGGIHGCDGCCAHPSFKKRVK